MTNPVESNDQEQAPPNLSPPESPMGQLFSDDEDDEIPNLSPKSKSRTSSTDSNNININAKVKIDINEDLSGFDIHENNEKNDLSRCSMALKRLKDTPEFSGASEHKEKCPEVRHVPTVYCIVLYVRDCVQTT